MKRFLCMIVLLCICMLSSCSSVSSIQTQNLGEFSYSLKTLDGLFFLSGDELCLISGTEGLEGSESQVFVYNVDRNQILMNQVLDNGRSMTAFCQAGTEVYFATISSSADQGCDLYAWDMDSNVISQCAHFDHTQGIYDLAWDGADRIFAATSQPAALYSYDISNGELDEVCADFTEEQFVRSLSYVNGKCYLGIGTDVF